MAKADDHITEAARAVRRKAQRVTRYNHRPTRYAKVLDTSPMKAELIASQHVLQEEHLTLGQWARSYDNRVGIEVGDRLVVVPMGDADWLVVEVVSENDPPNLIGDE